MICVKFTFFFCDLQADLRVVWPPFASPYASSGFANLRWLASTCESVWPPFASPYASSGFANLCRLALTCESVWPGLNIYILSYFYSCLVTRKKISEYMVIVLNLRRSYLHLALPSSHVFPVNPAGQVHLKDLPSGVVWHGAPCAHG